MIKKYFKVLNKKEKLSMILCIVGILFVILFMTLTSATQIEIRDSICTSINITGTNCTTWWDGFNFTDDNFTHFNTTNITVSYVVETHNHHYDYSNDTHYENKTYVYYNNTLNQSYLDNRYIREIELDDYVKEGEIENTIVNNTIFQTSEESKFSWWNVLTLILGVLFLGVVYALYKTIKEVEYLEEKI